MPEQILEADVVDDEPQTQAPASTAVTVRESATLSVAPQVEAAELGKRLQVIKQAMDDQMKPAVDYGVIPGTNKPTLLKPGAEKLSVLFQLDVQLENEKEWGPGDHLTVISRATVFHAPTGQRLGYGEGLCTTREKKYGKRNSKRACPQCGAEQINRSKFPPREQPGAEPGWYCHSKRGGCGAQFAAGDERITVQQVGEVENPDLPDTYNTVLKMAEKRARVDAILSVTGASALFTQDVEDQQVPDNESQPAAAAAPFGPPAGEDAAKAAKLALGALAHGNAELARDTFVKLLKQFDGQLPATVAATLVTLGQMVDPTAIATPEVA